MQLQFTDGFAGSFTVVAPTTAVVPVCIAPGGGVVNEMEIASALIVTVSLAVFEGSVTELATIVTVPPAGTVAGAVYVAATPLPVEDGLNVPHSSDGVQLQFTEGLAGSLTVVAAIDAVPPTTSVDGALVVSEMLTPAIVIGWLTDFVPSATEIAVIVTLPPAGTVVGAVYVVIPPLAVDGGLNEPHASDGAQLQFTPFADASLATAADRFAVAPTLKLVGSVPENATEIDWAPPPPEGPAAVPPQPARVSDASVTRRKSGFLIMFPL